MSYYSGGQNGGLLGPLLEPLPQSMMLAPRALEATYQQMGNEMTSPPVTSQL